MPTTAGVYTAALTNGTEVSSTYEGRHLTMVEDELMHPLHADVFVNKGDPVIIALALGATPHTAYGLAVGVAFNDGAALTDLIAIDTEGIWNLNVNAFDDAGGVDVNPGDALFISDDSAGTDDSSHDGVGNAVISKISATATQIPFGYALGYIAANAYGVIAVKVHWDPGIPAEFFGAKTFDGAVTFDSTIDVTGLSHLRGMSFHYGGLITAGTSTFGGPVICSSSCGVAGVLTTNQIACNSSLGVAGATTLNGAVVCVGALNIGGPLTMHQVVNALELPAADPTVAGQLWSNGGVITRSAG